jgi:DDE_Tnp_1-associated/Transposase DDE domain
MSTPLSLLEVLAEVPDPRSRHGRRHPFTAILSLAVVAMLSGAKSYEAIAQFGRDKGILLAHALGFTRGKTPNKSTFSVIFRRLNIQAFENALGRWMISRLPAGQETLIRLDGKTARGSRDGEVPGQHLVAAYVAEAQAVLAQLRVDAKTNEHKAALELLGVLPVKGNIISGDALFCQRDVCAKIIEQGGDYVFTVKDNQPSLAIDIQAGLAYQEQAPRLPAAFSPCGPAARTAGGTRGHDDRQRPRTHRQADAADDHDPDEAARLGGPEAGIRGGARTHREGGDDGGGSARHHQSESGASGCAAVAGANTRALGHRERAALPA